MKVIDCPAHIVLSVALFANDADGKSVRFAVIAVEVTVHEKGVAVLTAILISSPSTKSPEIGVYLQAIAPVIADPFLNHW